MQRKWTGSRNLDQQVIENAVTRLMHTRVADWQGHSVPLRVITDRLGTTLNVEDGARAVACELIRHRLTFHQFNHTPTALIKPPLKQAITHFYMLMHDDLDLASMGMGRGQMLLMQMDGILAAHLQQTKTQQSRAS